ncbi:hypothetical protein B0T19DRAFT_404855 [Cercophora scortea]|uniref:BTB domain-containing protein n=1 Tax=Cercophora scortea TaxID=314031 RepID=A0AAE0I8C6_9PEZI|nr:hypothetical protein B0T19DRAFT_404855 [Cercophora scortea]
MANQASSVPAEVAPMKAAPKTATSMNAASKTTAAEIASPKKGATPRKRKISADSNNLQTNKPGEVVSNHNMAEPAQKKPRGRKQGAKAVNKDTSGLLARASGEAILESIEKPGDMGDTNAQAVDPHSDSPHKGLAPRGTRPAGSKPLGRPRKDVRAVPVAEAKNLTDEEKLAELRKKALKKAPVARQQPWSDNQVQRPFTEENLALLEMGRFADCEIVCLKRTWKVHKTILCTRSSWFAEKFNDDMTANQIALHQFPEQDVEAMVHYIYAGALDMAKHHPDQGTFLQYANLFTVGEYFGIPSLAEDALTLLGQFCDARLRDLCSYDVAKSGRHGIPDAAKSDASAFMADLFNAIWHSYAVTYPTRLRSLLASFVWAGRARLLHEQRAVFLDLATRCPLFGNDVFKLALGENTPRWLPSGDAVREICTGFDHSRRTQHPDRCEQCDEVFDDEVHKKALYNPFSVTLRPAAWCAPCVEKNPDMPLWRAGGDEEKKAAAE